MNYYESDKRITGSRPAIALSCDLFSVAWMIPAEAAAPSGACRLYGVPQQEKVFVFASLPFFQYYFSKGLKINFSVVVRK